MTFKNKVTCDICSKKGAVKNFRIEWQYDNNNPINIHLCHNKCSLGWNDSRELLGDIHLSELLFNEETIIMQLKQLQEDYPSISNDVDLIIKRMCI